MANISHKGFNANVISIETNEELAQGTPVKMHTSGKCIAAESGDEFIGICVGQRGNIAAVQTEGYVELPYTGSDPNYGYTALTANGENGVISTSEEGMHKYKVISRNSSAGTVGFIL